MRDKFLAIDQGTSATKAVLFDRYGRILGRGRQVYDIQNCGHGYIEQDPDSLYEAAVTAAKEAVGNSNMKEIAAMGLSVQTGAFLLWHKITGKPLCPVVSWQCRRGRAFLDTLLAEKKQQIQNLMHASLEEDGIPAKLAQVFCEKPELYNIASEGKLCFGTMESWLIWRLTGKEIYKSDITNACITNLYLDKEQRWNVEAMKMLKIPSNIFPEVTDNQEYFGTIKVPPFAGIEIRASMGDSAAAMFGEGCWSRGQSKITYGTGASYLLNIGLETRMTGTSDICMGWKIGSSAHYVWEGTLLSMGSSVEWLKKIGVIEAPEQTETLAYQLADNEGVYFFPDTVLGGKRQNIFWGLDFCSDKRHLARAVLESAAFRIWDMQRSLEMDGLKTDKEIYADGRMVSNSFLMQFQADILDREIICSQHPDMSAFGAYLMSALSIGAVSEEEIKTFSIPKQIYHPKMDRLHRQSKLEAWEKIKGKIKRNIFREDL